MSGPFYARRRRPLPSRGSRACLFTRNRARTAVSPDRAAPASSLGCGDAPARRLPSTTRPPPAPTSPPPSAALRARPRPRKPRRAESSPPAGRPPQQPPSIDEQLDRAEICSRSGRIDEAIAICNALRASLTAPADPQSMGWCDFVLALSHLNAGRAKEAVMAGYRAVGKLAPGTRLLRSLTMLASASRAPATPRARWSCWSAPSRLLPLVQSPRDRCLFWVNCGSTYHALGDLARRPSRHSTLGRGPAARVRGSVTCTAPSR